MISGIALVNRGMAPISQVPIRIMTFGLASSISVRAKPAAKRARLLGQKAFGPQSTSSARARMIRHTAYRIARRR